MDHVEELAAALEATEQFIVSLIVDSFGFSFRSRKE
jgi:hypothetical protein